MNYIGVKQLVKTKLKDLDPELTYHNAFHTLGDVLPAVERLGNIIGLSYKDQTLLNTAALLHDLGFLRHYKENEPTAAKMARVILPDYEYSYEDIEIIEQLILATQLPQNPKTLLEKIICDADLDSLGREDYKARSFALLTELRNKGQHIQQHDWYRMQIDFLENHDYFTEAARALRQKGKQENIQLVKDLISRSN